MLLIKIEIEQKQQLYSSIIYLLLFKLLNKWIKIHSNPFYLLNHDELQGTLNFGILEFFSEFNTNVMIVFFFFILFGAEKLDIAKCVIGNFLIL